MNMKIKELYLFSPHEKKARRIAFEDGINVITSNQEDGTDRGKSVVMRSIYHTLGAESCFEAKWDTKGKVYILHFSIGDDDFYMYRSADLYKFFDAERKLIFVSTHSQELAEQLKKFTNFAVMLPGRTNEKLEITPPVYNYLPYYLDQDHYDGSKYSSFKNLQQYPNFKDFVLFYHLGIYDEEYFDAVRLKERLVDECNTHKQRLDVLVAMQEDIDARIGTSAYSSGIDSLKKEVDLYKNEYARVLAKLAKCKSRLIELRNNLCEYESLLKEMGSLSDSNEKDIRKLNVHTCPECGSVIKDTTIQRSRRYNLAEDIIAIKNELQVSIQNATKDIDKEEAKYRELLEELSIYQEKLKLNTKEADDLIKYKGLCEIRDSVVSERHDVFDVVSDEEEKIKELTKEIKKYNDRKKDIEEKYYELLIVARSRFGLNEIEPEKFKKLTNVFTASGSNKNIATVIWYLTIIALRRKYNENAIDFPIVFDSPNNVETDNMKKHALLEYILENAKDSQLILSSIGFDKSEFEAYNNINVILLENDKYNLLDERDYTEYKDLLDNLCDAEL